MDERNNTHTSGDFSGNSSAQPLLVTDNTLKEICSFSKANVNEIKVVENAEDIDENPAPLPNYLKKNNNEEAALPPKVSELKNVLDESRKKLSEIQKKLVEKLHDDDAKILQVNDNGSNSASVYLQFDKRYGDNTKIKNAINKAIEYAKNNKQNFEIKPEYLPYIKSIFVDRKSVEKYSQGGGDDEVLLNGGFNDRKLTSLKFYQKHNKHPGEGKYNMIMVAEYKENNKNDDIKQDRKQYCIIDMDNNLMISNDSLKLYCHGMDEFENYGFDDEKYKVYETGLQWCAFRINNRLRNDNFTEAKKFILTNGSKLYGVKTLEGVTNYELDREFYYAMEGTEREDNDKWLKWAEALIGKISTISNSINNATTIQQLYETFLQDIQKDLLKVNLKSDNDNNNFLYLKGKDIVDFFSKNSVNKTINSSDFNNDISTSEFKQKILGEIFQNNTGGMAEIEFVKAFLENATQHIVNTINKKIETLNKPVHSKQTNNEGKYRPPTKLEGEEHDGINNNTAKCGCCKGFSLCNW